MIDVDTFRTLLLRVAGHFCLNPDDIEGFDKREDVAQARQVLMVVLRLRGYSCSQIGAAMNRHHSTVVHALSKLAKRPTELAIARHIAAGPLPLDQASGLDWLPLEKRVAIMEYLRSLAGYCPLEPRSVAIVAMIAASPRLQRAVERILARHEQSAQMWRIYRHAAQLGYEWRSGSSPARALPLSIIFP